jgi:hypothetical protein
MRKVEGGMVTWKAEVGMRKVESAKVGRWEGEKFVLEGRQTCQDIPY